MEFKGDGEVLWLWSGSVLDDWLDYNGHMTEFRYAQVFSDSTDAFLASIGIVFSTAKDGAYFTAESHIRHLRETPPGTAIRTSTELLAYDEKRLHLFHRLFDDEGNVNATSEHLLVHVAGSRVCVASPDTLSHVAAVYAAQCGLPVPERTGSVLTKALANSRS